MGRKLKGKQCYYCGASVTSMEHAPPTQMFKMFPCDKVTVYSCNQHNTSKSGSDEAIIKAMLISLSNTSYLYPNRSSEIKKAIEVAEPYFHRLKSVITTHPIMENPPDNLGAKLAHLPPQIDIRQWMRQLTAALVYNAIRQYDPAIRWDEALVESPYWIPAKPGPIETGRLTDLLRKSFAKESEFESLGGWQPGWPSGPNNYPPDIYRFELNCAYAPIIFKHRFFNSYSWYVGFEASQKTKMRLIHKLRDMNGNRISMFVIQIIQVTARLKCRI
jgi:hypothetical protein